MAFVLTVTSWIGYHNSLNRPRYFIRFTNLPLWQFLTDVALVIVYWLLANYVDDSLRERSALPEAVLTLAAFALYFVWDRIGLAMRRAPDYTELVKEYDNPDRRYVTELFAIVALLSAVIVFIADVRSAMAIVVVDVWLIVVVAGFRVAKEATPTIEPSARPSQERLRRALDALERALVDLKSLD
ncbi:MAG TPA: hypothetical protein VHJ34_13815 [Actinomycetota bacterium]|nr:hypothetical protein [Actinomycetota bacterium]